MAKRDRYIEICTVKSKTDPTKHYRICVDRTESNKRTQAIFSCNCFSFRFCPVTIAKPIKSCKHIEEIICQRDTNPAKFYKNVTTYGLSIEEILGVKLDFDGYYNGKLDPIIPVPIISKVPLDEIECGCGLFIPTKKRELVICKCGAKLATV